MTRVLVWALVALALLGIFYKIARRGGVNQEARRDDYGHLAVPAASGAVAAVPARARPIPVTSRSTSTSTSPPDRSGSIGFGLSFALADASTAQLGRLDCRATPAPADRPHEGGCNPYKGDTSCRTVMPVACYHASGARSPANEPAWSHGELGATEPVMGALLKSESQASARCEAELGPGWRMAEFHDGGGWAVAGQRGRGLKPDIRYWVHINDQPGNCWNSAP